MIGYDVTFLVYIFYTNVVVPRVLLVTFHGQLFSLPSRQGVRRYTIPQLNNVTFGPMIFFAMTLLLKVGVIVKRSRVLSRVRGSIQPLTFTFYSVVILCLINVTSSLVNVHCQTGFIVRVLYNVVLVTNNVCVSGLCNVLNVRSIPL